MLQIQNGLQLGGGAQIADDGLAPEQLGAAQQIGITLALAGNRSQGAVGTDVDAVAAGGGVGLIDAHGIAGGHGDDAGQADHGDIQLPGGKSLVHGCAGGELVLLHVQAGLLEVAFLNGVCYGDAAGKGEGSNADGLGVAAAAAAAAGQQAQGHRQCQDQCENSFCLFHVSAFLFVCYLQASREAFARNRWITAWPAFWPPPQCAPPRGSDTPPAPEQREWGSRASPPGPLTHPDA